MTTERTLKAPIKVPPEGWRDFPEPLPDPPLKIDAMQQLPLLAYAEQTLSAWFRGRDDVLVSGQGYLCPDRKTIRTSPAPDLVIALGVDARRIINTNGYVISEVGKPPEFVLEVASKSTGARDYTVKRDAYAAMGVREYWRFDASGGQYHDASLAGDRLNADGAYTRFDVTEEPDGEIRGYSPTLELALCWVGGQLRFYDPVGMEYLPRAIELMAQRDQVMAQRDEVTAQRDEALLEVERLREELRRLQP
jgi:Uma2 family endonuclease